MVEAPGNLPPSRGEASDRGDERPIPSIQKTGRPGGVDRAAGRPFPPEGLYGTQVRHRVAKPTAVTSSRLSPTQTTWSVTVEPHPFFVGFGWLAIVFGGLLLVLPSIQILREILPAKRAVGLLISGVGFLMFGCGLAFAHVGLSPAVLPGVILTTVGHLWQRRVMKSEESA